MFRPIFRPGALAALTLVSVVGCGPTAKELQEKGARDAAQVKAAAIVRAGLVKQVVSTVGQHELVSLRIPVSTLGSTVNYRHCWVWRDAVFKTTSMHCDADEKLSFESGDDLEPADERMTR